MTETTQEERDEIEDRLLGYPADTLVTESHDIRVDQGYRLLSDADRLAKLEDEIQRLADNLVHEANGCRGTVESITKREDSKRLRALLGD